MKASQVLVNEAVTKYMARLVQGQRLLESSAPPLQQKTKVKALIGAYKEILKDLEVISSAPLKF